MASQQEEEAQQLSSINPFTLQSNRLVLTRLCVLCSMLFSPSPSCPLARPLSVCAQYAAASYVHYSLAVLAASWGCKASLALGSTFCSTLHRQPSCLLKPVASQTNTSFMGAFLPIHTARSTLRLGRTLSEQIAVMHNGGASVHRLQDVTLAQIVAAETFMTYLLLWTIFFNLAHIF